MPRFFYAWETGFGEKTGDSWEPEAGCAPAQEAGGGGGGCVPGEGHDAGFSRAEALGRQPSL